MSRFLVLEELTTSYCSSLCGLGLDRAVVMFWMFCGGSWIHVALYYVLSFFRDFISMIRGRIPSCAVAERQKKAISSACLIGPVLLTLKLDNMIG